ncbi:hypothetical protein MSAN_01517900 [Mycena sanguinolenta]|uniref:Uncharacterized protein n=1 Tax=Mycena sanguinolenta TaxID=230812 RepID=A0A8H6Y7K0_9AGAR|nr:hypothetical protein MSAN_01517900 [Mycena sanguinolenta]
MKFGGMLFGPPSFLPPQPENSSMADPSRPRARPRNNRRETSRSEDNTIPASDADAVPNNKDDGKEPEDEGGMSAKAWGKHRASGQGGRSAGGTISTDNEP